MVPELVVELAGVALAVFASVEWLAQSLDWLKICYVNNLESLDLRKLDIATNPLHSNHHILLAMLLE